VYSLKVVRPLAFRLLAMFLAVLPTVWGNCPCWFTDAKCCGVADAPTTTPGRKPCCPRCAKHDAPAPGPTKHEPAKGPGCGGCEGCPTLATRFATSLAPTAVQLPDLGGSVAIVATAPDALAAAVPAAPFARPRVPWLGPLGPPSPVDTTVLRF
jgi:hypothetical protein